jgi:biopolymer transport protein ExbD
MRAEINVTPLIDVMLVLLILFMVATPTARRTIDTQIPPPGDESRAAAHPLVITVETDAFLLNGEPLASASELGSRLQEVLSSRTDRTVFVRPQGAVTYGRVVEAMDEAKGAGAERIGIVGAETR